MFWLQCTYILVPEQVTDLTVIPGIEEGEPVILIRWTAPRSDAGIMNYIILYGVSSSELMQNVSIPANLEEPMFFNITGELGTDYSVQLAAVSVLGTGPFSNVTQITTFDGEYSVCRCDDLHLRAG